MDASGLGEPVMDMLRGSSIGGSVVAVKITGGERATRAGNEWHVPKGDLMAGLQVVLEKGELPIARRLKEDRGAGAGVDGYAGDDGRKWQGADGRGWVWAA